ncbi:hypothetical protein [Megasphaera massiliensis]|jgi:hypothetical protein|uniref:hypothetical protein n=1 Tax=Megasphaera massiliensis TaxID=1232428 RepID=UPI0020636E8C|nr:hypothetical protein [uncultured Megasphaera sp.]DAH87864.1 MAG TPA: hypothetical protein [Bacteriophage sp.]
MASGGWIGKVVSGLFNWGSKSYTPPQVQQVQQMRASDIVSSTQSAPPDAPVMGSDTEYEAKKRKKRGLMSLYVSQHGTERKDYTGRSEL